MARSYSKRDLKILFSLSAGLCNECKRPVFELTKDRSNFTNIGDIAHNRPYSTENGPRSNEVDGDGYVIDKDNPDNSYFNLILLCKNDHEIFDTDKHYTVERVQRIKASHEQWVSSQLTQDSKRKSDKNLIDAIFNSDILQPIFNSYSESPYTIDGDIDYMNIIRDMLDNNRPVSYPFKDHKLQSLTSKWFDCFSLLKSNLNNENIFIFNPYTSKYLINESNYYLEIELNNIRLQVMNFDKAIHEWFNYCRDTFSV